MFTLRDVLVILRQLDVLAEEVKISPRCFDYLVHEAKKVAYEDQASGDLLDEDGEF